MNEIIRNSSFRIIARLDIKNEYIVKGINFEGIRKVGSPKILAQKYYNEGIDEIIYMDVVASLYERNTINSFIKEAARFLNIAFLWALVLFNFLPFNLCLIINSYKNQYGSSTCLARVSILSGGQFSMFIPKPNPI